MNIDFDELPLFSELHCEFTSGIDEIVASLVEVEGCDINRKDYYSSRAGCAQWV